MREYNVGVYMCQAIRPSAPLGVVMTTNRPLHCHHDEENEDVEDNYDEDQDDDDEEDEEEQKSTETRLTKRIKSRNCS